MRLKCKYGDDIRRISLTDPTFENLCHILLDLYSFRTTHILVKYLDDQGDLVTIASTEELQEAIEITKELGQTVLRVVVAPANENLSESSLWLLQSTKDLGSSALQQSEAPTMPVSHTPGQSPKAEESPTPQESPTPLPSQNNPPSSLTERLQLLSISTMEDAKRHSDAAFSIAKQASDSIRDSILAIRPFELPADFQENMSSSALLSSKILEDVNRLAESTLAITQYIDTASRIETDRLRNDSRKECDKLSDDIRDVCVALVSSTRDDSLAQANDIASVIKSM